MSGKVNRLKLSPVTTLLQWKCIFQIGATRKCTFFNYNAAEKLCQLDFCHIDSNAGVQFSAGVTSSKGWNSYLPVKSDDFDPNSMKFRGFVKVPTSNKQQSTTSGSGTTTGTPTPAPTSSGGWFQKTLIYTIYLKTFRWIQFWRRYLQSWPKWHLWRCRRLHQILPVWSWHCISFHVCCWQQIQPSNKSLWF